MNAEADSINSNSYTDSITSKTMLALEVMSDFTPTYAISFKKSSLQLLRQMIILMMFQDFSQKAEVTIELIFNEEGTKAVTRELNYILLHLFIEFHIHNC